MAGAILAAVVLGPLGNLPASAQSMPLFKAPTYAQPLPKLIPSPFAKRTMVAAFESRALSPTPSAAAREITATLDLNLFGDTRFQAQRTRLNWTAPGHFNWIGTVAGDPASQVVLVSRNGGLTGSIHAHGRIFEILSPGGGNQIITELDPAALEAVERENPSDTEGPTLESSPEPATAADSLIEIDIMVLYEASVASKVGDIKAFIESLVAATNESYVRSLVPQKIRLVHTQVMVPGSSGSGNLSWLRSSTTIGKLRDEYGADLVSMLIESDLSGCGIGNVNGPFTLVKRSCALGNRSFAHELGHNMGALHNREEEGGGSSTAYNYGYIDYGRNWRTIMAYATNCSCPRINNFSNPSVLNGGGKTGVADKSDNARMLRAKSLSVSRFRASKGSQGNSLVVVKHGSGKVVSDIAGVICGADCEETFPIGDARTIRLTATPDSGWTFKGWEGDCLGTGACNLTMNSGKTAVARFEFKNFLMVSLWDVDRNLAFKSLGDSTGIRVDSLPSRLTLSATAAGTVGSIHFELMGQLEMEHIETKAPYALFGDSAGKPLPWNPKPGPGKYRITVTAYEEASGAGASMAVKQLVLDIKQGNASGITADPEGVQPAVRRAGAGFELVVPSTGYLDLRLHAWDGRTVRLGKGLFRQGVHPLPIPSGYLGKGVHNLQIIGDRKTTTRKLVLLE